MKKLLLLTLAILSLTACSYQATFEMPGGFKPKVVLNSFISPKSTIKVDFYWSRLANDDTQEKQNPPRGIATLFEDGKQIASEDIRVSDAENISSRATFDCTPLAGHTYSIVANIEYYGEVSATTYVPKSCDFSAKIAKQELIEDYNYMHTAGIHTTISDVVPHDNLRSVWFYTFGVMTNLTTQTERIERTNYGILFCDNPYVDNVNRVDEVDLTGEYQYLEYRTGDPMYYSVVRLAQADIDKRDSFKLASEYVHENGYQGADYKFIVTENMTSVEIAAISPSDDYDRYQKSKYQQDNGVYYFDMTPISFDDVRVYNNVKNGLGIFAGYNTTSVNLPVNNLKSEEE